MDKNYVETLCNHFFHDLCLKKWKLQRIGNRCPICRIGLISGQNEIIPNYIEWFNNQPIVNISNFIGSIIDHKKSISQYFFDDISSYDKFKILIINHLHEKNSNLFHPFRVSLPYQNNQNSIMIYLSHLEYFGGIMYLDFFLNQNKSLFYQDNEGDTLLHYAIWCDLDGNHPTILLTILNHVTSFLTKHHYKKLSNLRNNQQKTWKEEFKNYHHIFPPILDYY